MHGMARQDFGALLRARGFKATPGRITLLRILQRRGRPLSLAQLAQTLGRRLNQATVYRALEALVAAGMLRKVDFQHAHSLYELVEGQRHHHHLLCRRCGLIEDITGCDERQLEQTILRRSRRFDAIESHAMEFFGRCKKCARASAAP